MPGLRNQPVFLRGPVVEEDFARPAPRLHGRHAGLLQRRQRIFQAAVGKGRFHGAGER